MRIHRLFLPAWLLCQPLQSAEPGRPPHDPSVTPPAHRQWKNGPRSDDRFFPIAVWLQSPRNAAKYKAIGINLYVGLWNGPTEKQLQELERQDMPVICSLNDFARTRLDRKIIVGWMHGDEPDNAQPLGRGKGYGPPVPPESIRTDYDGIVASDPTRPVFLNLGQGVAWDGWHGRGVRTNHPEDYPAYARGGDIISFDIYPVVHDKPAVAGNLWFVPRGVSRLRHWAGPSKLVWNCIEATHIGNPETKPTPDQVKAEVWMSIIHGSRGIIYFSHQFKPRFIESGILADPEMSEAIGEINQQIRALAPVLNAPTPGNALTLTTSPKNPSSKLARALPGSRPVAALVKYHPSGIHVFAVGMESSAATATFKLPDIPETVNVEVLGENRVIQAKKGVFIDHFDPHAVHIYRIRTRG